MYTDIREIILKGEHIKYQEGTDETQSEVTNITEMFRVMMGKETKKRGSVIAGASSQRRIRSC